MNRTQSPEVIHHFGKFIFQFAWALLSSVAFLLVGGGLPESFQVYTFACQICESVFKINLDQVNLHVSEFRNASDGVLARKILLQINDPLLI